MPFLWCSDYFEEQITERERSNSGGMCTVSAVSQRDAASGTTRPALLMGRRRRYVVDIAMLTPSTRSGVGRVSCNPKANCRSFFAFISVVFDIVSRH